MTKIDSMFWRAMTPADFFNIERSSKHAPATGGGQSYISISFTGMTHEDFARFLMFNSPERLNELRSDITIGPVRNIYNPDETDDIEFKPRYKPGKPDGRYRIARQNRQSERQSRHPAWTSEYGFPKAIDDISSKSEIGMPDLTLLKIFIAKDENRDFHAGYFNSSHIPEIFMPHPEFHVLFQEVIETNTAGIIDATNTDLTVEDLANAALHSKNIFGSDTPEVQETLDQTRVAAGRPMSGQGRRTNVQERIAIEKHAVEAATEYYRSHGWKVEDVGLYRSYDLECRRNSEVKHVEVKGTTGNGSAVILTPNEVTHAHNFPNTSLVILSEIEIQTVDGEHPRAGGGVLEIFDPWEIDEIGELRPTGYSYAISQASKLRSFL